MQLSGRVRRARRRGQAAVLIALSLFSLVIFLAMATNMGILVNDRVRMQNAADLGAYAAAYKEAQQLNLLVEKNKNILEAVKSCRDILVAPYPLGWPGDCNCTNRSSIAETIVTACELQIEALATDFLYNAYWGNSVSPALDAGKATMDANIEGLSSSGGKILSGVMSASMMGTYWADGTMFTGYAPVPAIANYERVDDTYFNYPVMQICPTPSGCVPTGVIFPSRNIPVHSWYYKDDADPDIWVMAEAKGTFRAPYLDIAYSSSGSDGGYFGGSSVGGSDQMVAVAVAKPFGGSVGPTKASTAQRNANTNPKAGIYWAGQGTTYAKMSMQDEYRARVAGFHEWDGASADTNPRTAYMLSGSKYGLYASKLRH